MSTFDAETLDRWRAMEPRAIYDEIVGALHRAGASTSGEFLDAFEEIVDQGLLSWDEIEVFEGT